MIESLKTAIIDRPMPPNAFSTRRVTTRKGFRVVTIAVLVLILGAMIVSIPQLRHTQHENSAGENTRALIILPLPRS